MTQREILDALSKIGAARRGQITEQWYTVKGSDGAERRQGPYYVWTRYDGGKKLTARVRNAEVERTRCEIEKGQELNRLMGEFWRNAEMEATGAAEKNGANFGVETGEELREGTRRWRSEEAPDKGWGDLPAGDECRR